MKSIVLGLAGAMAVAASSVTTASAADMFVPPAEPQVMPPAFTWSGPYVGFNAGYFWSDTDASVHIPEDSDINADARAVAEEVLDGDLDDNGFTGGLTLGLNHQFDSFVLGVEGDLNFLDLDGTRNEQATVDVDDTARGRDEIEGDFLATFRLRLGLPVGQTLFYVTGGGAYTDAEVKRTLDWNFGDPCPDVGDGFERCHAGDGKFDLGWVAGAGVEHAFSHSWSAKVEYLYADFGEVDFTTANPALPEQDMNHSFDLNMHIVRAGLNLHF